MAAPYVLVVDDEPDIGNLVREILEDEGYEVSVAEGGAAARAARQQRRPDIVLLDIWMPDVDGITLLKEWSDGQGGLPCPVIMLSGHGSVETAVEATRLGAYDFLEKPLSLAKLLVTVERALEADKLSRENAGLRWQVQPVSEPIGKSTIVQRLREQVQRIAQHDTWVLISGEPGSGKETFARYLHACSARAAGPFIDVAVGSIARENSAVELFGSEHQGQIHYGKLEQANGGILFLDDVADMDPETQSRLVSALESQTFLRVGGKQPVHVDVRVIAATHRELEQAVRDGAFREDLYYHLNVVPLQIPPLREHCEDVPELLDFYSGQFADREGLPFRRFAYQAKALLQDYHWPGNVRELKNLVQRLLILGVGSEISADEVGATLSNAPSPQVSGEVPPPWTDVPLREARERFERAYLRHQLNETGGSVGKLAKVAGMERTHLYRKLRQLGIDPKYNGDG